MSNFPLLLYGDSIYKLKELESNSVDAIVTDPPYGLSFMGKKWDYDVPSKELWIEALRVLKPGGHLLSFGGTRTYHRMVVQIEDAGFEIRDQIQWIYGSGFPKSHNIKDGEFKGWGTALKPAHEPIVVARKPLEKGLTVAENVLKWECGALNIDASRIGTETITTQGGDKFKGKIFGKYDTCIESQHQGRWPANVLFDEDAASVLDEQTKDQRAAKPRGGKTVNQTFKDAMFNMGADNEISGEQFNDSGGASRFFYVAKASKRERNAGLEGIEGIEVHRYGAGIGLGKYKNAPTIDQNHHPTIKPIKLMEYLIKLVTPPNGIVLDPFMGSGSTGVAAKSLGFNFVGIELSKEYFEIASKRIKGVINE